jgi:hypothetical protein
MKFVHKTGIRATWATATVAVAVAVASLPPSQSSSLSNKILIYNILLSKYIFSFS